MARGSGSRNDLVKCEYCGEMYSVTYKHCPFCNEDGTGRWDDEPVADEEEYYEDEEPRGGGRRLSGGGRGPRRPQWDGPSLGTIIGGALSLALIVAAIFIVLSIFRSINGDNKPQPTPTPTPTPSASVPPVEGDPVETTDPTTPPTPTTPSIDLVKPTSFTLSKTDMSFFKPGECWDLKVKMEPADATAEVTWKSSDPNIASVSWNGRVTAVSKGTVTVTATIEGLGEQTCIVRCNFDASATPAPKPSADNGGSTASSGNLKLSREDFTLAEKGDSWKLTVSGTTSTVTWSSSKPEVATVAADGTVTNVGKGNSTITAEVDGVKLTCIVRCK